MFGRGVECRDASSKIRRLRDACTSGRGKVPVHSHLPCTRAESFLLSASHTRTHSWLGLRKFKSPPCSACAGSLLLCCVHSCPLSSSAWQSQSCACSMNAACSKSFCCFTCVRLFEAFARGPLSEGAASSWDVVSPCGASPPHPDQPSCGRRLPCVSLMSALHGRGPLFEGFSTPSGPTVLRTATAVRVIS